jgi:hypothetical protein
MDRGGLLLVPRYALQLDGGALGEMRCPPRNLVNRQKLHSGAYLAASTGNIIPANLS